MNNELIRQSIKSTKRINAMEDKIAKEWYGCSWDELEYDDKELVTNEAYDRLKNKFLEEEIKCLI